MCLVYCSNHFFCSFLFLLKKIALEVSFTFNNNTLVDIWNNNNRNADAVTAYIMEEINEDNLNKSNIQQIKAKVTNFEYYIKRYLRKYNRNLERFKSIHTEWFAKCMEIKIDVEDTAKPSPSKMGRPKVGYAEAGPRLRRQMASEVAVQNDCSTALLLHAASASARKSNENKVVGVLRNVMTEENFVNPEITNQARPDRISNIEALAFLLENNFTKQQYISFTQLYKAHGCNICPGYDLIRSTKLQCRPSGISISETVAKVSLQDLLNHTAERILTLQNDVLEKMENVTDCTLIISYGFDGSTGQSSYKQKFDSDEPDFLDQSLFVSTVIPIRLIDSLNRVIWLNRSPQSVRFCRPLKIEYAKESSAKILGEKENLDMQVITGTKSNQCCPICAVNPKRLIEITDFNSETFRPQPGSLKYGVSPLHAWIRFMEFVLNISYRMDIKTWHIKGDDKNKMMIRKKEIQQTVWKVMGLHISIPKQNGSGNSNDGNTARRIFANTKLFASITLFDEVILNNFYYILIAVSCEFSISPKKYRKFCKDTFNLYMKTYPWYPMSPTVHKILVHGADIINLCIVPVGCLGENASEARNKHYKMDRRSHARKNSRLSNMADVFNRAMDSSDPLISSYYINKRLQNLKKKPLPIEVINLLENPTSELSSYNFLNDEDTESDNESDDKHENSFVLDEEDY